VIFNEELAGGRARVTTQQRKYEYSEEVGERSGYGGNRVEWL